MGIALSQGSLPQRDDDSQNDIKHHEAILTRWLRHLVRTFRLEGHLYKQILFVGSTSIRGHD